MTARVGWWLTAAALSVLVACTSQTSGAGRAPGSASLPAHSTAVTTSPAATPSPSLSSAPPPTAASSSSGPASARPHGTVVLIPGYGGDVGGLAGWAAALRAAGRRVVVVALPDQARGSFAGQALTLDAAVRAEERAGRGPVDIVAHSNGGVLARYWERHFAGGTRARRIIALGSPQHGTTLADLAFQSAPALCGIACQQVRPGSTFLRALNQAGETPRGASWVTVFTDGDEVVLPPASAALAGGAINIRLQAVCLDAVVDHSGLLSDPVAVGVILDELASARMHAEGPADCARLRALGR